MQSVAAVVRTSVRFQCEAAINPQLQMEYRIEQVWSRASGETPASGFLTYLSLFFKTGTSRWAGNVRFQFQDIPNHDARIYAYEQDVLYAASIPAFGESGWRYFMNLKWRAGKQLQCWLRWSQTFLALSGKRVAEIKLQIQKNF